MKTRIAEKFQTLFQTEGEFFANGTTEKHELNDPVVETISGATYSVLTCKNCIYIERELISEGCTHADIKEINIAATCTENGVEDRKVCANPACNKVLAEGTVIPAGHKETVLEAVPPTCEADGLTEGKACSVCGTVLVEQTVVPSAGAHVYADVVTIPATHFATGLVTYTCGCGDTYTETLPKTDAHEYQTYVYQEATCTDEGLVEYYCECGHSYTEVVSPLYHNDADADGKCDNCGEVNCDHMCHRTGFVGFIWKIIRAISKLFGANPVCECGAAHY